ncbi:MAG: clostripain [Selenomonadaceae bacterium]|nr:clostripain [Selenomonadaceae bacterium]
MQRFRRAAQKFFLLTIFLAAALLTTACGGEEPTKGTAQTKASKSARFEDTYKAEDTWVIYWYVCGTDLETEGGAASADIQELLEVPLPPNVKVVAQTGGTNQWQNNVVSSSDVERFVFSSNGLERVATLPDADMGDANTLADFIRFGKENYDADHKVFVFWDHGGGSAVGICLDERTGHMLSLNDVRAAFTSVYEPSAENPPFELIGFDACLMATYDTVNSLDGLTRYVTASEEVEPGIGWYYTGWVGALAKNPAMGGAKLGQAICNTYMEACATYDVDDMATLSVIDLAQLPYLRNAYESFGLEALRAAHKNPKSFFSKFGRGATNAENYGGNTRRTGYTNMVDIVDLARANKSILPDTTDKLIGAVDEAVIYKVSGEYRDRGGGLSSFHSYSGDEETLVSYLNQDGAPVPQKLLYYYLIYGELPADVIPLLDGDTLVTPAPTTPPPQRQEIFQVSQLEDLPVQVDKDGNSFVQLSQEQMDLLSSVHCQLVYMALDDDIILYLGSDADINADWDSGIFKDNFRGVWPMLDGHPVYIEITEENEGYNLYSIPIKLNGVECNLQVAYVYDEQKYYILGARKGLDSHGMSSRELIKLHAGDEITTLHYGMTISGEDEDFTQVEVDTFQIGEDPQIKDEKLGDGTYGYAFEFVSPTEESALSDFVIFTITNGEITTTVDVQ